ncbi:7TM chemoreceptor [Trichostrongylus colubriformis]|uniref:7TM chemoreceptor n=1 Tax=Trichostrongylus colubriformis TaxID=6319 RepID=A0AAN8ISA5_TRICO
MVQIQNTSVVAQEEKLDHVFSSIYCLYTVLGAILNSFLLFLIVSYKQDALKRYRILLGNTTCTLLLLSILTLFLQLRFVMTGDSMAYVSLGPARFLNSPRLSLFATAWMLVTDIYSFMTIAMCMVYKYITVTRSPPSVKRIYAFISLFYLLPLSTGVALIIYNQNFSTLYSVMEVAHPEYHMQRYGKYCGLLDIKNYFVLYFLGVVCLISALTYGVMIVTCLKIRRYILSVRSMTSSKSARMFNMMIKGLVIQSCMPIFFSFPTKILYFAMQFGGFESLLAEYMVALIKKKLRLSKVMDSVQRIDVPAATVTSRQVHFTSHVASF